MASWMRQLSAIVHGQWSSKVLYSLVDVGSGSSRAAQDGLLEELCQRYIIIHSGGVGHGGGGGLAAGSPWERDTFLPEACLLQSGGFYGGFIASMLSKKRKQLAQ